MRYLEAEIEEVREQEPPPYGRTVDGYTRKAGAPSRTMIRLKGEGRWRRLMFWQFSNCHTFFLRVRGVEYVVRDADIPSEMEVWR